MLRTLWRCRSCLVYRVFDRFGRGYEATATQKQPTPQAVIDEHVDALNKCDWNRIMAQYPTDYQLNLPDGMVVKGREAAGKLFADFVKPDDQGGLCGIKFTPEQTFVVGKL